MSNIVEITFFVEDSAKIAHRIEKVAYGYRYNDDRWIEGKVDEDDLDAVEITEEAINIVYSAQGEEVTLELPAPLAEALKKCFQLSD